MVVVGVECLNSLASEEFDNLKRGIRMNYASVSFSKVEYFRVSDLMSGESKDLVVAVELDELQFGFAPGLGEDLGVAVLHRL